MSETHSVALALFREPTQIMRAERERLEGEIVELQERQMSLPRAFAVWRQVAVFQANGDWKGIKLYVAGSFVFRSVQWLMLAAALWTFQTQFILGFVLSVVLGFLYHFNAYSDSFDVERVKKVLKDHLLRTLVLPVLPLLRGVDLAMAIPPRGYFIPRAPSLEHRKQALAKLKASDIVPAYYHQCLIKLRAELLGPNSSLRVSEKDLQGRLERVRMKLQRYAPRLKSAQGNADRMRILEPAYKELEEREQALLKSLAQVQQTVAKTSAVIEECRVHILQIQRPLEDAEFVAQLREGETADANAGDSAKEAVERHYEVFRDRIFGLEAAMKTPLAAPDLDAEGEPLSQYFQRVEALAERVSTYEATVTFSTRS